MPTKDVSSADVSLDYYSSAPRVLVGPVPVDPPTVAGRSHLFAIGIPGVINLDWKTFSGIKPPFISPERGIGELARGDNDLKLPFSQLIGRGGIRKRLAGTRASVVYDGIVQNHISGLERHYLAPELEQSRAASTLRENLDRVKREGTL